MPVANPGPLRDVVRAARRSLPEPVKAIYRSCWRLSPSRKIARVGTAHRRLPISGEFGKERGAPIDRYYIDNFVRHHSGASKYSPGAIHGHVLEIGEDSYTRRFGLGVERVDILDASPENPLATIVAISPTAAAFLRYL
jgi:hypothetical protein